MCPRTISPDRLHTAAPRTDLRDDRVVIRHVQPAEYPEFPYLPSEAYPEHRQARIEIGGANHVYNGVRNTLADLGLDADHFGLHEWNPFGAFVSPGQRAVIKPNWVLHANQSDGSIESLITHTSLIRALIDYLVIALRGDGAVEVVDAPLQNCDFDELLRRSMISELIDDYRRKWQGIAFSILDLRKTTLKVQESKALGRVRQTAWSGDPRGYTMIDLGQDSILADIGHRYKRFRVANYDHRLMWDHHNRQRHEYLVSNSILSADFLVNVPKLKFHIKAGVTAALKNLVGINGHKEYLPHHTNGAPARGGDQYEQDSHIKPLVNRVYDDYWTKVNRRPQIANFAAALAIRLLRKGVAVIEGNRMYDGAWSGNDTIPRTTLDLNHALYFHDSTKQSLSDTQVRSVLHIVDGVVAGDGLGPLKPSPISAGVILGGWNPLAIDVCGATLMGLVPTKVPLLKYGLTHRCSRLAPWGHGAEGIRVTADGVAERLSALRGLGFRIPKGWESAVCDTRSETRGVSGTESC